ncbi:hypothetical protein NQZ79_g3683 [Umbelopsis isabellina]|nr:hypothetical protein NQZ79_g3683 [Umbelopsis isabellina]
MTAPTIPPTTNSLKPEQIKELKSIFKSFDRNHDGTVSRDEMKNALTTVGVQPSDEQLDAMLPAGKAASFETFCEIMLPTYNDRLGEKNVDQELLEAFRAFDKDGNGVISALELKNMMRTLGDKVTDDEINNIMNDVDVNGDGVVNYEEFVMMMKPNSKGLNDGAEIKRKKEKNRKSILKVKGWFHKLKREK